MVDIAQLVSVPGCGPGGRGFESHYSPHNVVNLLLGVEYRLNHDIIYRIRTGRKANNPVNCEPAQA